MRLPLARLELTRTGRNKNMYRLRLAVPAFCAALLWLTWEFGTSRRTDPEASAAFCNNLITNAVYAFQLFVAFLYTPLLASETIAKEKQERTLPLLLMTGAREADVIVAKGLSVFLQAEILIFGCLPLQTFNTFFGGLTLEMVLGQQIVLAAVCVLLTSLGLLCSAVSFRPMDALTLTLGGEALWLATGALLDATTLGTLGWGPAFALSAVNATYEPSFSWSGLSVVTFSSLVLAISLCACALYALRRTAHVREPRRVTRRRDFASMKTLDRFPWLRQDPIGRLYAANVSTGGGIIHRWPWWICVLVVSCVLASPWPVPLWPVIVLLIIYDVSSSLSSTHEDGSMELLFVTSISEKGLVRAIYRTHLRRACVFLPSLFLASFVVVGPGRMQPMAGLPEVLPWGIRYAANGVIASVEAWLEAIAYVSLGCLCVSQYGHIARQALYALGWLFGLHVLAGLASVVMSALVAIAIESGARTDIFNSYLFTPGNVVAKISYFFVLVMMSRNWYAIFQRAVEKRWRVGEPLAERSMSRLRALFLESA
ncbi:MAG: hypothetical protein IT365_24685 [Candidatus Hydrogenedentes bacterium]|nr:hypothetical protein [Candidatus Hydrogenedentota bacterium]